MSIVYIWYIEWLQTLCERTGLQMLDSVLAQVTREDVTHLTKTRERKYYNQTAKHNQKANQAQHLVLK